MAMKAPFFSSRQVPSKNSPVARKLLARGIELHQLGKWTEAASCFESVLRLDQRNSDALHLLGVTMSAQGQTAQGIELIRKAVKIQPQFPAAFFNLGNLLRKENLLEDAVSAYQRAISLQRKFPQAYRNLGSTLDLLGRLEDAAAALEKAVECDRNYAEAHSDLTLIRQKLNRSDNAAATSQSAAGSLPIDIGAIKTFKQAADRGNRDPLSWSGIGTHALAEGNLIEAEAACRQAIALRPDFVEALRVLAKAIEINLWTESVWTPQRDTLAKNADCIAPFETLGAALFLQGKLAEAVETWSQTASLITLNTSAAAASESAITAARRHIIALETPQHRLSLDVPIFLWTGASASTACVPCLSWIGTAASENEALHALDSAILKRIENAIGSPGTGRILLRASPGDPSKRELAGSVRDTSANLRLFTQQLYSARQYREAWECLRLAKTMEPLPTQFISFLGMLTAVHGDLDLAIATYLEALHSRLRESDMTAFWREKQHVSLPRLLKQAAILRDANPSLIQAGPELPASVLVVNESPVPEELLRIEACNYLAEALINYHNAFALSREMYLRRNQFQQDWLRACGIDPVDTLFLGFDWVRNIGHIAFLGHLVKMRELGLAPWRNIVVFSADRYIANHAYLNQWRQHLTVVTDPGLVSHFEPLTAACGFRFSTLFPFPGREPVDNFKIAAAVEEKWRESKRAPLLSLTHEQKSAGWDALAPFGPRPGDWFVCLHVRESGFHSLNDPHRNAGISDYLPAIEVITRRGGWVIRLGDSTMSPLPALERVIDYPHTRLKSPVMDVFLCAETRFFIGVHSGLSHVPHSFGRPSVMTNWLNTGSLPPFGHESLFLPKMIRRTTDDQLLPLRDSLSDDWGLRCYGDCRLDDYQAELVANTPGEIVEIVSEMLDRLDGVHPSSTDDIALREKFFSLFPQRSPGGLSSPGAAFLRRHRDLL